MIPLMFLSFFFGGIIGLILLASKIKKMKDMIPFGPYIALASTVIMFFGTDIVNWYMTRFYI
jgi:leader peptidase (prepilin peptidase)/N-methyltransferase